MKNNGFATSDFQLATFLFTKGFLLLQIAPVDAKKKVFVFEDAGEIDTVASSFWAGKELIDPLLLLSKERELKRRLYSDSYEFVEKGEKNQS
ncbi:MAG TPA: DUF5659 domain-containing protein [Candidatus Sulfotelmatobacter sp.]|nr:DUF5659 domain-containing protein [Candidatus Sulfotelmatobacter sp.]